MTRYWIGVFIFPTAFASMPKGQALFEQGLYQQAYREFKETKTAAGEYWAGVCQSRVQAYNRAVPHFKKAIRMGTQEKTVHYELGQAYYGTQQLGKAVDSFARSLKAEIQQGASAYYMGYIEQIRERYAQADKHYRRVPSLQDSSEFEQAALFQRAEIALQRARKDKKKIKTNVIPLYEQARDEDTSSPLGKEARRRLAGLQKKYGGAPVRKHWGIRVRQGVDFDSNVVSQADQARIQLSNTSALVSQTAFTAWKRYQWGKWSIKPQLRGSFHLYSRRSVPRVFQNDQIRARPGILTERPHSLFGKKSTFLFDLRGSYLLRDYRRNHSFRFYNWYADASFGERIRLFPFGDTTVRLHFKRNTSQDRNYNASVPGASIAQQYRLWGLKLRTLLSADFQKARNARNDLYTYTLMTGTSFRKWGLSFRPNFVFSLVDTRQQSNARGTESVLLPGLQVSRALSRNFTLQIGYQFTRRISKDKVNYDHVRHLVGAEIIYRL